MRMFAAQLFGAEPLLLQLPVAKIFHEHVGAGEQPVHGLAVLGLGKIEHDAALAAVEQREERGSHAAERAGLVADRRLDLDDLGAELRQDHAAGRAHHHMGHLDDPHAVKRQSRPGHRASPVQWALAAQTRPSRTPENYNLPDTAIHRCITQLHGRVLMRSRNPSTPRSLPRLLPKRPLAYLPLARAFHERLNRHVGRRRQGAFADPVAADALHPVALDRAGAGADHGAGHRLAARC